MIADTITALATISLASAAIGALLQYMRDQIHYNHKHHHND